MTLHVVVKGRGVPVLVLHGLLSDHTQVYPLLPALAGCKAYFPDLLGCGKTDEQFSVNIVRENAALLGEFCRKHHIQTVIAYSMAGMIALELGLPNTIFVSAYCTNPVLHGPLGAIKGREPAVEILLVRYKLHLQKLLARMQYKDMPGLQEASVDAGVYYLVASLADHRREAKLLRRALVVHGTQDQLIYPALGEILADATGAEALFVHADHTSILHNKTAHAVISRFIHG